MLFVCLFLFVFLSRTSYSQYYGGFAGGCNCPRPPPVQQFVCQPQAVTATACPPRPPPCPVAPPCPPQYCPPPPICPPPPPPPPPAPCPPTPTCPPPPACPQPQVQTLNCFPVTPVQQIATVPCSPIAGCGGSGAGDGYQLQRVQYTGYGSVGNGGGGYGGFYPQAQVIANPAQNDCCCHCTSPCRFRRRRVSAVFGSKLSSHVDPSCSSKTLRRIILENISVDPSISKRKIQHVAQSVFGRRFDVVCGRGDFSYVAHTEVFCQETRGDITCYAFQPL